MSMCGADKGVVFPFLFLSGGLLDEISFIVFAIH